MMRDIEEFVINFEWRTNYVKHGFSSHLFSTICESFYDCELLDFFKSYVIKLYVGYISL